MRREAICSGSADEPTSIAVTSPSPAGTRGWPVQGRVGNPGQTSRSRVDSALLCLTNWLRNP